MTCVRRYNVGKYDYKLRVCDHILNNIYGQIGLTEVEKQIEHLPIFKRLHSLSQLGLVKWIFPCALHTRYVHSIGVMHIAGEMAKHININMNDEFFCDSEIQILRLIGLLHDIGHYPLSHNIELAYKEAEDVDRYKEDKIAEHLKHYVNCPEFLVPPLPCVDEDNTIENETGKDRKLNKAGSFLKGYSGSQDYHHEKIGFWLVTCNEDIRRLVKDNFVLMNQYSHETDTTEQVLNPFFAPIKRGRKAKKISEKEVEKIVSNLMLVIGSIIIGNYGFEKEFHWHWMDKYSVFIQLIHSDLDADNLDYLLRDATFSGTSYGLMDMSILLNCLYVKKFSLCSPLRNDMGEVPKRYIVGVTKKGVGSVEQFLFGKFMAYSQMIFSKYVSILEAMILKIESEIIIPHDEDYKGEAIVDMVKKRKTDSKYLRFTDSHIFNRLYLDSHSREGYRILPNAIISRLTNSTAFDLADKDLEHTTNECACVAVNTKKIIRIFSENPLYQEFERYYNTIKDRTGKDLANTDDEAKLFSYHFENYSLTDQIEINKFEEEIVFDDDDLTRFYDLHYYRLGKGIPILDIEQVYSCDRMDNGKIDKNKLPPLCVDSPLSILKDLQDMKFVVLRKYKIRNIGE